MPGRRFAWLLAGAVLTALAALAVAQEDKAAVSGPTAAAVEIKPEIMDIVAKMPQPEPARSTIKLIRSQVKLPNLDVVAERHYERLENHIWVVSEVMTSKSSAFRRGLMWHGLVDLAATTELGGPFSTPGVIPLGKLFLPFSIDRRFSAQGFINTVSIAGDLAALALPKSGSIFAFDQRVEGKNTVTFTGGLFSGPRTSDIKAERRNRCVVGEPAEASTISVHLRGTYFPVTCEDNANSVNRKWAYLLESNLYVLLATVTRGSSETHEITGVDYVQ